MTNKVYFTWDKAGTLLHEVIRQIQSDTYLGNSACKWQPDYVVGIVRGGCFPAGMYSHYAGVPMYALKVQLAAGAGENKEDDTESDELKELKKFNGKVFLEIPVSYTHLTLPTNREV